MRCVSGGRWTLDGRWVVVGPNDFGLESILYDPALVNIPGPYAHIKIFDPWTDLQDCLQYIKDTNDPH